MTPYPLRLSTHFGRAQQVSASHDCGPLPASPRVAGRPAGRLHRRHVRLGRRHQPARLDVSVTCEIKVNNITKDSFSTSGTGFAVGADEAQFLATDADS